MKTLTLSLEQYNWVQAKVSKLGFEDLITVSLQDYRDEFGSYDAVVSCEMIEAVGKEYLPTYFAMINRVLKPNARAVIQAITIRDEDYNTYSKNCDWIQKHIFPGGHLPSLQVIKEIMGSIEGFEITDLYSFGIDYAKTLSLWQERFNQTESEIIKLGFDSAFQRKWNYYFSYCIAGFTNKMIDVSHVILEKRSLSS